MFQQTDIQLFKNYHLLICKNLNQKWNILHLKLLTQSNTQHNLLILLKDIHVFLVVSGKWWQCKGKSQAVKNRSLFLQNHNRLA